MFFYFLPEPTNNLFLGKRYFRTNLFCIQYFPASKEKQRECNGVAERMYECLEYITIYGEDTPIRGTKVEHEVVDGVLNFFVNYDCFIYKKEQQTPMEVVSAEINVRG